MRSLRDQLTDARAQLASVLTAKQEIETERNLYEDQIELVKDMLRVSILNELIMKLKY